MARLLILVTAAAALGVIAALAFSPSMGHAGDQQGADLSAETVMVDDVRILAMPAGAFEAEPTGPFRQAAVRADFIKEAVGSIGNAATANSGRTRAAEARSRGDRPDARQAGAGGFAGNTVAMVGALESHTGRDQTDHHTLMPAPPATIPGSELSVRARRAGADGVVLTSLPPVEAPASQAITSGQQPGAHPTIPTESATRCVPKAPALLPQPATGNAEHAEPATVRHSLAQTITPKADPNSGAPSRPAAIRNAKNEATSSTDTKVPVASEPGKLGGGGQVPTADSTAVLSVPMILPAATCPAADAPSGRGPYPQCRYLGCSGPLAWRGCVYCEEIQHYDYYPAMHGYYYFAPYNAITVPFQQAFVARYHGDPRDPYTDGVFQAVYAAYRAAHPVPADCLPPTTRPERVPPPEPANPFGEAKKHSVLKRG